MEALPIEIIILIFGFLDVKNLKKMEISKKMRKIVRDNKWKEVTVRLIKVENIKNVINNYSFMNFTLRKSKITDEILFKLKNCNALDLSECT